MNENTFDEHRIAIIEIAKSMVVDSGNLENWDCERWVDNFLNEERYVFGYKKPIDVLKEPDGFDRIKNYLKQIAYRVYI